MSLFLSASHFVMEEFPGGKTKVSWTLRTLQENKICFEASRLSGSSLRVMKRQPEFFS